MNDLVKALNIRLQYVEKHYKGIERNIATREINVLLRIVEKYNQRKPTPKKTTQLFEMNFFKKY